MHKNHAYTKRETKTQNNVKWCVLLKMGDRKAYKTKKNWKLCALLKVENENIATLAGNIRYVLYSKQSANGDYIQGHNATGMCCGRLVRTADTG